MTLLLRAIVEEGVAPQPGLVTVAAAGLAALASDVTDEQRADEASLRTHQRIVDELHARVACLPARFGRTFPDAEAVGAALATRADELRAGLREVGDRVEIAVTLAWRAAPAPRDRSSGSAYLRSAAERDGECRHAEAVIASLLEACDLERPHVRHRTCPRPGIAAAVAVLMRREEVDDVIRRITRFGERSAVVSASVHGPTAPYSFVS